MRRLICILLLLCLPLQSFAAQGGALLSGSLAGQAIAHELDHAAEIEHNHEDDGSVHYDDSDESVQHSHESSASLQQLLPRSSLALFSPLMRSLAGLRSVENAYAPVTPRIFFACSYLVPLESELRRIRADERPLAGTRLLREWAGVEHVVTVLADGFEWEGRPYRSLSAIARAITGTRWNGWRFFGIRHRGSAA